MIARRPRLVTLALSSLLLPVAIAAAWQVEPPESTPPAPPATPETPPGEAAAPETPAPAAITEAASVEDLKKRLEAAKTADLDEETKAKVVELYGQAVSAAEQAETLLAQAATYTAQAEAGPARLQTLRQQLSVPAEEPPDVAPAAASMTLEQVEQSVRTQETDLATAKASLEKIESRLAQHLARPDAIEKQTTDARGRLEEIERSLAAAPPPNEPAAVTQARRAALEARRRLRQTEIAAGAQELATFDIRQSILTAERDLAAREVARLDATGRAWLELAQKRREQEAKRVVAEAERAEARVEDMPEPVRELARMNTELAERLKTLREAEQSLTAKLERAQERAKEIDTDFESARQRVDVGGLNETIGLALRQQRQLLPNLSKYRRAARKRADEMSVIVGAKLDVDARRRALTDLETEVMTRLETLEPPLPDNVRAEARSFAETLLADQMGLMRDLETDYNRYLKRLGALDNAERELVDLAQGYGDFIDEHLLWIRSAEPLDTATLSQAAQSAGLAGRPSPWSRVLGDTLRALRESPVLWGLAAVLMAVLVWLRSRARRWLKSDASKVGRVQSDSIVLTLRALGATVLRAATWPALVGFVGWQMHGAGEPASFTQALGGGLMGAAVVWATLGFARALFAPNGPATAHFKWNEAVRRELRFHLLWLMTAVVPLTLIVFANETVAVPEHRGSVGRMAFMAYMVFFAAFTLWILRPGGAFMNVIVRRRPEGWIARLRYGWYPVVVAIPLSLAILAGLGYYYTALQLQWRLESTVWLLLGLLVAHAFLMRWVHVTQRRLAYEEAVQRRLAERERRESGQQQSASAADDFESISIPEQEVRLEDIGADTRRLIRTLVAFTAVIVGWLLWADVLPALNVLKSVELWYQTATVDGTEQQVPVTLANVGLTILIIIITFLASRNLPGALEITLLKRLPMDAGARYAFTTICRYIIVGVGLVLAVNGLGMNWSSVQWLLAALTVGLGFGLQEIVANFVSGIIILFERPFRVGDIVTVGDVSGMVSRIRIRATTIVDFDRRELIVPNKRFITNEFINSTLSNAMTRIRVPVGIAYGADVSRARRLLLEVARANELVLDDPAPGALFLGFGDSALNLELRAFVGDLNNRMKVTDQLHEAIDDAFKEAGIEIVFPQRDINLKTSRPVEVRVVGSEAGAAPPAARHEPTLTEARND